ncbi:MAG: Sec-independent protein translocase subunit TatA/TatB [Pirellulaceae bacterium]
MLVGFFGVGHLELLIVAFVVLLLFGNRLPGLMRSLGRGVVEFKQGLHGANAEDDDAELSSKSKKTEKIKAE